MSSALSLGKLPSELLAQLLKRYGSTDPRVVVPPGVGLDCAVIEEGLIREGDPVTLLGY